MSTELSGYYNRFDETKNYESLEFRAGRVLQSAELNEVQSTASYRHKMLGDALFKDGDRVRDAQVVVDPVTGAAVCSSGAVYLRGQVRGVPTANIVVPTAGTIAVGIYLVETTVTVIEDPELRDPASETRNYQEEGAARLQVNPVWGCQNDGTTGEFFPIYVVENGVLQAKEAPPVLDSVNQAIARYDRDSNGSNYVVSGLSVTKQDDLGDGRQVYSVADGRARINGLAVNLATSRRVTYDAQPVLRFIDSEPYASVTASSQRVNVARTPIAGTPTVRITAEKTVTLVHGSFSGAQDPLPDNSVVSITSVKQGATTYAPNADYKLTAGKVDWSPSGAEPGAGQSYDVTYQYVTVASPTAVDATGYSVAGAVPGTLIYTSYNVKLPRIDRMCLDENGLVVWLQGISTDYNPVRPQVPSNLLALCQVQQTWTSSRTVTNDGVRMVSMSTLEAMNSRLDLLTDLIAQQTLVADASTREASATKGLFVDPFLNDSQRDQGLAQSAAVVGGALTLAISGTAAAVSTDVKDILTCDYTLQSILSQELRTGSMQINPYLAFAIVPAKVTLTPAVDRWTEAKTVWSSSTTQFFTSYVPSFTLRGTVLGTSSSTSTQLAGSTSSVIQNLRQISVSFEASGFGPNEELSSAIFDGLTVDVTAQ